MYTYTFALMLRVWYGSLLLREAVVYKLYTRFVHNKQERRQGQWSSKSNPNALQSRAKSETKLKLYLYIVWWEVWYQVDEAITVVFPADSQRLPSWKKTNDTDGFDVPCLFGQGALFHCIIQSHHQEVWLNFASPVWIAFADHLLFHWNFPCCPLAASPTKRLRTAMILLWSLVS